MKLSNTLSAIILALIAAGCSVSPEDPRKALAELQVPYNVESFVAQAGEGDTAAIELFLAAGVKPNAQDKNQTTALMNAAAGGHLQVVQKLLANGANPNIKKDSGLTALGAAVWNGDAEVVGVLVDKGADVLAGGAVGQSPLMLAVRGGRRNLVNLLLAKGAHAYVQDDKWSPLMLAAFLGDDVIVKALLARDANVNASNAAGMTSLMYGASRGHTAVVQALLAKGANASAADPRGHTALMFAANNGQTATVKVLGGDPALQATHNRAGATAATLAGANGHSDIVELLAASVAAPSRQAATIKHMESADRTAARELSRLANQSIVFPAERQIYADAAKTAWRYVERHYQPVTGLVDATQGYPYTTVWDIASSLGALYTGHELKLLDTPEYDLRMRQALRTLKTIGIFDGAAFNKLYSTRTGAMIGRNQRPSKLGYGWSATDLGRLLVWLKIVAVNQPQYQDDAAAVVNRLAMNRLVKDGYLWGEDLDAAGAPRLYQEGQIGYEQYAAQGFALWGFTPQPAMRLRENGLPITVMGKTLLADIRGRDRVTSDPFILMGLELGWNQEMAQLAGQLLAVQEERYRKTGRVTLVAEDAVSVAPHFFFYYSAYTNNKDFGIDVQSPAGVENPRWVSSKAAFAWHALLPSAYTEMALRTVMPARSPNGWSSGVYEGSGKSTETLNINTAAVILTAALVHATGQPLLSPEQ